MGTGAIPYVQKPRLVWFVNLLLETPGLKAAVIGIDLWKVSVNITNFLFPRIVTDSLNPALAFHPCHKSLQNVQNHENDMTAEPYTTKQKPVWRLVTFQESIHQFHMAASVMKSPYPGKALDGIRTLGNDQGASVTRRREKTALAWYVWSDHLRTSSNSLQISNKCLSCERGNNFFPYQMPPIEPKQPPHPCLTKRQRILFQSTIFREWCIDHVPMVWHTPESARDNRDDHSAAQVRIWNFKCAAHALRL